jgi:hypothetical protein
MVEKQRKRRQLMKATIITYLVLVGLMVASYEDQWAAEARNHEARQIELWQETLKNSRTEPDQVRLDKLERGLFYFAQRSRHEGASTDVRRLYQSLQDEIISIPGHARYYRDDILRAQAAYARDESNTLLRMEYDETRGENIRMLHHLPSPETLSVLGEFLSNDFVKPDPHEDTKPVDYSNIVRDEVGYGEPPPRRYSNPWKASWAIMNLGLRETPIPYYKYGLKGKKNDVEAIRAWWEQVKAGKKDISFICRPEIYRFTGDGSWEMVGKVDAEIVEKELAAKKEEWRVYRERMEKVNAQYDTQDTQPPQKPVGKPWFQDKLWIGACALLALIFAWLGWRIFRKST